MTTLIRRPETIPPLEFRSARHGDGADLWRLVQRVGTLELNSAYFYMLFASDFGDTCLVAEHGGRPVGTVIGYRPPRDPYSAFVWQIGIAPELRGHRLGARLLQAWLDLPANRDARWLTATVASDNLPSQKLFRGFARLTGVSCDESDHFPAEQFPHEHPAERLFRIGPLSERSAVRGAAGASAITVDT